jgi:hypothetical protein
MRNIAGFFGYWCSGLVVTKTLYTTTDLQNYIQVIQQHHSQGFRQGPRPELELSYILDPGLTLGPQPSPVHEALYYIVEGYHIVRHKITLLEQENGRLHEENQWRRKKKEARRSYVARGGLLQVKDSQQLASEKAKPTANSTTQRLCDTCKLPGHNRRIYSGIQDSIHIAI